MTETAIPWGPTGEIVYERTYSRKKPDGTNETWPETVRRVAYGNLALVYGDNAATWSAETMYECKRLVEYMEQFKILPAGRHLWASGVKGRQFLFNCHVSGWGQKFSDHFEFTFMRLMEGGGVGANYSSRFLEAYDSPRRGLKVHVVCDPAHPDYQAMRDAGLLSDTFDSDWHGAFPIEDSREGWAAGMVDLLDTYFTDDEVKYEDRVYDVSRVRQKGARLKTFGGTASGPQPFARMLTEIADVLNNPVSRIHGHLIPTQAMEIDHAIAECVVSGGVRRSARMAICHWSDPFIQDFISCKADGGKHWTTNISVEIDDDFTYALNRGDGDAVAIHQAVVTGMLTNGEPGYWNSSLSNHGEIEEVIATNPCGEIALTAWENCNLGHVNMDAFAPQIKGAGIDWEGMDEAHKLITRFLIRATYGDVTSDKQAAILAKQRRIGVGHLGVQGYLAKIGVRYSDAPTAPDVRATLRTLYREVRQQGRDYAFELRIPEPVKVTTVAPTGSIAKLPGVAEGIHPIYARFFIRRVRFNATDDDQWTKVVGFWNKGLKVEQDVYDQSGNTWVVEFPTMEKLVAEVVALGYAPETVESADEISLDNMLSFQAMYQTEWADNAVSFTANVPDRGLDPAYIAETMETIRLHLHHLKGTTIMVDGTRAQAPYERITEAEYDKAAVKSIEDGTDEDCANGACPVR